MANKPYKALISSALDDLREISSGIPETGPKIPAAFRGDILSPASKLFSQAGMDPNYFENWWWLLNTLAEIHLRPRKKKAGWRGSLANEELLEAIAFLKGKYPDLSDLALCSRLFSNKNITGLRLSEGFRRKIGATKTAQGLYRQFRYAIRELEAAQKGGFPDLFAPVSLLKVLQPKKVSRRRR